MASSFRSDGRVETVNRTGGARSVGLIGPRSSLRAASSVFSAL
jgi:hypothetical protein